MKLETQMENNHEVLRKMEVTTQEALQRIERKLDSLPETFAAKWAEKVIVATVISIISGAIFVTLKLGLI